MVGKYVYINKKNGIRVYSDVKLDWPDLELVTEMKTVDVRNYNQKIWQPKDTQHQQK